MRERGEGGPRPRDGRLTVLPAVDGGQPLRVLLVVGERAAPAALVAVAAEMAGLAAGPLLAALAAGEPAAADGPVDRVICWRVGGNGRLLAELAPHLQPDGRLLLVDLAVPGSRLRGKQAKRQRQAGDYVNTLLRFRDPGHPGGLSAAAWQERAQAAGLRLLRQESCVVEVDLAAWSGETGLETADQLRLQALVRQAPAEVQRCLTWHGANDRIALRLAESLLLMARAI